MVLPTKGNIAMVLAAGLGSRLKPMTESRPKALVEWQGISLLEHVLLKLKANGFTRIIINIHHFADMIVDFLRSKEYFGMEIHFSREPELLDTGGGIAQAAWFLKEAPFLVYNVDVLSSIDLKALYQAHLESGAIATMAVKERVTSRSLLMDEYSYLKGWRDNRSGETILVDEKAENLKPIAFSAVHIMNPEVFHHFPAAKKFAIMPFYLELARTQPVFLYRHDRDNWTDMGRLESYA